MITTCYVQTISDLLEQLVASLLPSSTLLQDDNNLFQTFHNNWEEGMQTYISLTKCEKISTRDDAVCFQIKHKYFKRIVKILYHFIKFCEAKQTILNCIVVICGRTVNDCKIIYK